MPAVPVRHVPGEQEAHHDPQRVHRVDDGDGERRQVFVVLVETVEATRSGRKRRHGQEREGYRPEARAVTATAARGRVLASVTIRRYA